MSRPNDMNKSNTTTTPLVKESLFELTVQYPDSWNVFSFDANSWEEVLKLINEAMAIVQKAEQPTFVIYEF